MRKGDNKMSYYANEKNNKAGKIIVLAAIAAVIALLLAAIAAYGRANRPIETADQLVEHIEKTPVIEGAKTVSEALLSWKIPEFDPELLMTIEVCYEAYYYKDLPSVSELARDTAIFFANNYFESCNKEDLTEISYAMVYSYIGAIGDPYSSYRTAEEFEDYSGDLSGVFAGIGVHVEKNLSNGCIRIVRAIVDSPAAAAGVETGDLIIGVDGFSVAEIGYKRAIELIRGEIGTSVNITVMRGDEQLDFTITRATVVEQSVIYELLADNVALITITSFKANTAKQFNEAIDRAEADGARGIVFDLRSNPGGYVSAICNSLSYLVPNGTPIASFSNDKSASVATDGTAIEPTDHVLSLPSVVICNEYTASAGELFAAAMRDYANMELIKCTIVGHTTYKKGVMQSSLTFESGAALTLTTAYYNPPSGVNYDGVGVVPDVILPDTAEDGDFMSAALAELEKIIAAN